MFYSHFVKDETPFRYANAEIRTRVIVICDLTRYQLDHLHAPKLSESTYQWHKAKQFLTEQLSDL